MQPLYQHGFQRQYRRLASPLALLAWLLLAPAQAAEEAGLSDAEQARLEALAAELRGQQARLQAIQSEQGIYGPGLIEAHADLGALHMELDDPDSAVRAYTDALQLARINNGLYSSQQLPIIASLIEARSAQAEWMEVDDLEHLRFHIASRLHEPQEPGYLAAASEYGRWKLRALKENLLGRSAFAQMNSAEELSAFYERVLLAADSNGEVPPTQAADLLYGRTQADIAIARAVAGTPYTSFTGTAPRYITQTRCRNVTNSRGEIVRECYQVRVDNPRYRQSQREAKRFALMRQQGAIADSLEELRVLHEDANAFSRDERERLQVRIAELESAVEGIRRSSRGSVFSF